MTLLETRVPIYSRDYWCGKCCIPIPHEEADENINGAPKCPICGKQLRMWARGGGHE